MTPHQLINQTSGSVEYYTPPEILDAARAALGEIDLDPFSSPAANERVCARRFFTAEQDAFKQEWHCDNFWMNHPFGREFNKRAILRAQDEVLSGRAKHGLCITYACTSEKWFLPLLRRPQCFLYPRTNYYLPDGTLKRGVTKGSVVTYFGQLENGRFAEAFRHLGIVKFPA